MSYKKASGGLTYEEAMKLVEEGKKVARMHWHWIYVANGIDGPTVFEEDGTVRMPFQAVHSDKQNKDWIEYTA